MKLKTKIGKFVSRTLNRVFAFTGIPEGIKLLTKAAIIRDRLFLAAVISTSLALVPSALLVVFLLTRVDFTERWMHPTKYILQALFISLVCVEAFLRRYTSVKRLSARWRQQRAPQSFR
ncbi:hypothetical protein [Achromobacter spanius]|uniref:ABC transmembrane type-1 domain-containing protein n=1 Tax=Achromobacter spanius TaxID=217203 RepID=A0AAW3HWW8_9BURK|nr:hypothetical protein [Achromobacter spanius]KNE23858.1 hypothetical protein AFM18_26420 [Achromobacter spanius]